MRWTLRIGFLLILGWAVFMVSPFIALYDLSRAVEAKDLERVSERVNFRALRVSLSRQILGAYLDTPEGRRDLGDLDPRFAADAGAAVLNPLVEELLTPQALADLLEDGWPQQVSANGNRPTTLRLEMGSVGEAFQVFIASETQGFRSIAIPLPPNREKADQFRLTFRLSGITWRLTGVELPQALRKVLARRARDFTG